MSYVLYIQSFNLFMRVCVVYEFNITSFPLRWVSLFYFFHLIFLRFFTFFLPGVVYFSISCTQFYFSLRFNIIFYENKSFYIFPFSFAIRFAPFRYGKERKHEKWTKTTYKAICENRKENVYTHAVILNYPIQSYLFIYLFY